MEIKLYFLNGETVIIRRKFRWLSIGKIDGILRDLGLPIDNGSVDYTVFKSGYKKTEILVIESKYLPARIYHKIRDRNTGEEFIGTYPQEYYNSAYDIANEKFPNLISQEVYYKSLESRTGKD